MDAAVLPVARLRAAGRAVAWSVPALLLGVTSLLIFGGLHFVPSGISNRLVDYGIAVAAFPVTAIALWAALKGARWLLLSLWPARLGVFADERALTLRLGPFGSRTYDTARLEIRYPFELSDDAEGGGFESFLPEEEQRSKLLPRIRHPAEYEPLNRTILRFVSDTEEDAARKLRPLIDQWRNEPSVPSDVAGK